MKFFKGLFFACILSAFAACDNEVDINSNFEEATLVYGLLDKNSDTQFVKVNRTFLDEQLSAIDLANQTERINYDSLTVSLTNKSNNEVIPLEEIIKPKDPGIFSTEENILYYTTERIEPSTTYELKIVKPDGSETFGETTTIDTITVINPRLLFGPNSSVSFTNSNGNSIEDYKFIFRPDRLIGEFEVRLNFLYAERVNGRNFPKKVSVPIGRLFPEMLNPGESVPDISFIYRGDLFFQAIEDQVPPSTEPTKKIINQERNIEIEIYAADRDYSFYRDLNGPLEGLAQTRPEFTNIDNGIGLFASRFSMVAVTQLNERTRNFLIQRYRSSRNFATE